MEVGQKNFSWHPAYPDHLALHTQTTRTLYTMNTLLALFVISSASTATALSKPKGIRGLDKALSIRGGVDVRDVITGLAYASSAFIFLPAGRDIVSYQTAILPGEAETRPLMTAADPAARSFTWGLWGLNHCFITLLKIRAIKAKDVPMLKLLFPVTAATFLYCLTGNGPVSAAGGDLGGFVAVCAVQTASIGYLAFA